MEVVKLAIEKDGSAFRFASKELRNNLELAKIAVSNDGTALQYCLKNTLGDIEVQSLAVTQNVKAINWIRIISPGILHICLELNAAFIMQYLINIKKKNYSSGEELYPNYPANHHANENGRRNWQQYRDLFTKDLCMIAVTQNGSCLRLVPQNLREDREGVIQAVSQNGKDALQF